MEWTGLSKKWVLIAFVIAGISAVVLGIPNLSRGESYIVATVLFVGAAILSYLPNQK